MKPLDPRLLRYARQTAIHIGVLVGMAGDTDLGEVDMNDWRARVAWLPQDPVLFAGTVASNIRLGKPGASGAEVAAAALTEIVLETQVGESGKGLSAGQRRRWR